MEAGWTFMEELAVERSDELLTVAESTKENFCGQRDQARISEIARPPFAMGNGLPDRSYTGISGSIPRQW